MLLCYALSPYEEDPCSFWERLVSSQKTNITSYSTDLGEDGVRRCRLMVDLGSSVTSNGNWRWFKVCCMYQAHIRQSPCYAHPCTCTNRSRILARLRVVGCKWSVYTCISGRDLEEALPVHVFL